MSYKSLQAQINRAAQVKDAMDVLARAFGDGEEFTRKQAEKVLRLYDAGVSFDAIVKHNGVTKIREEEFTITVSGDNKFYYLYTSETGYTQKIYSEYDAEQVVERFGGRYELVQHNGEDYDIDVKRYYYTLTPAKLKLFNCYDLEREKALALAKLNEQMAKLKKNIALLESI